MLSFLTAVYWVTVKVGISLGWYTNKSPYLSYKNMGFAF